MCRTLVALGLSLSLFAPSACPSTSVGRAQLFGRMGPHTRTVTTASPEAQAYFDEGLNWTYAFNHDEAIRSFTMAAALDPECAMAWWGVAWCQGPNYNDVEMTPERNAASWEALQRALALRDHASPLERELIDAMAARYADPAPEDRAILDQAYAEAMAGVWERHPEDADVATLYAEALMVQIPWMLYELDHTPAESTPTIVATLERAMELDPRNPGANHLYIHAVEPSSDPYRGVVAADRLSDLVPGAGHLEHMPSHIYVKTGFWDRAVVQNQKALAADVVYRALSPEQGIQHMYMVHNAHMLAYSAMMCGREQEAMAAARRMWSDVPEDKLEAVAPFVDLWMCSVYDVQKRFGRWDDLLAEPGPPSFLPITNAIWRAHRAVAYAALGDLAGARREQAAFRKLRETMPEASSFYGDPSERILKVSEHFIAGEIALQQEDWEAAAEHLEASVAVEDSLAYGEPPQWLQPVRHTLGAVYLKAGRPAEAEHVYRDDLAKWPRNGWSLLGLAQALRAQGKDADADQAAAEHAEVWAQADIPATTSCLCIESV